MRYKLLEIERGTKAGRMASALAACTFQAMYYAITCPLMTPSTTPTTDIIERTQGRQQIERLEDIPDGLGAKAVTLSLT